MKSTLPCLALLTIALATGCDRARSDDASGSATDRPDATTVRPAPSTAPATQRATTRETADQTNDAAARRLVGTWVAENVDASMGQVKVKLTFVEDGPVKIAAWSELPLVGQVREVKAPYEVHGNTISSDALRGGTSVKYRFDGQELVIEYQDGKTIRFHRA